ncbi:hypothetical protein K492DRAFT_132936 [Lichtheimia hyalospora FSU 10163]|nr:hypothetical protein K492DRAFT_132936 [Lichtheimia hyalospora FSU 10163]
MYTYTNTEQRNICPDIGFYISRYPLSVLFSFRGLIELLTSIPFLLSRLIPNGQYIYDKSMDVLQYKQVYLIGNIVILLYNGMAAFQYSEAVFGRIHYDVLDSLFMVVVTLSTVGYGGVSVIPSLISDLLDTMQKRDGKSRSMSCGQIIKDADPFILIVGTFTVQQAKETLDGFLNTDNVDERLSVVFLDIKPLTDELKLLGRNSVWGHRIHFLHSSVLDEKTLQRAQSRRAKAIFCISDSNAPDPVKEDERNTVRLWSMHCYTARHNVPIYTYNLSPITAIYQEVAKEVICVRQFNQYLLALNCRCRGASTFLTNLLHQRDPLNQYDAPWEAQYGNIICTDLLYKELQVILFAVRTLDNEIILNPAASDYTIQPSDVCVYIAQSSKEIRSIASLAATTIDPSPPNILPTSKPATTMQPSRQRYKLSRLPSSSHSLLSGISVGGTFPIKLLPLMCHLLDKPAKLKDITIHKASGMRGHILVCMQQEFINIFKFIYNLRQVSSHVQQDELQDIVLLCSQLPSEKAFHPISLFPCVYIMEGNCRQPDDLLHAGIKRAKQVVVMRYKGYYL